MKEEIRIGTVREQIFFNIYLHVTNCYTFLSFSLPLQGTIETFKRLKKNTRRNSQDYMNLRNTLMKKNKNQTNIVFNFDFDFLNTTILLQLLLPLNCLLLFPFLVVDSI